MKGNQESGADRWSAIHVPTMSFYEYCELTGADRSQLPETLKITPMLLMTRHLPALDSIRNAAELERIFLYLCNVSSEIVPIEAIAKELSGVSRPTVESYIQYLESANLIYQSRPVDMTGKKVMKARPKIYIADAAIRNAANILIEVKYRKGALIPDTDAIAELCGEASAAIIVTKSSHDFGIHHTKFGKDILRIPAFAFLYLFGSRRKHGYQGIG